MKKNYIITILSGLLFLSACYNDNSNPTPTASNASDFKTFATKTKSALVNYLPKMYELPK
ncbi:hypothetical protein CLU83_0282 [Flavobacterium sp. 1]|uniref:hypothetical protein n=1 Tax=Flavobacterium sp. 1 TaxID=2035200 RepID=UPI000C24A3F8|nr:hypothetical protein [Flavobacterium sp. 1]PJJ07135.1 hypothetical protein CLU83_0282 [Flavobacterium sp. 1]